MAQRGRPSLADRLADAGGVTSDRALDKTRRLRAPADLTPEERALWETTVYSKPATWFGEEHVPMLRMLVHAGAMAERLAEQARAYMKKHAGHLEEQAHTRALSRLQMLQRQQSRQFLSLARSMRLTHQSGFRATFSKPQRSGVVLEEGHAAEGERSGKAPTARRPWDH